MERKKFRVFTESYCYGPADLTEIRRGDSTLWVRFRDSAGKTFEAIYDDCVYWHLGPEHTGIHLSLVERITADELAAHHPETLWSLRKNATDVYGLLKEWETGGLNFYLHRGYGAREEYLVVAGNLRYREA